MEKIKEFFKNIRIDISKISLILVMFVILAPLLTTVMRLIAVNNFFVYKVLYVRSIDISLYTTYIVGFIGLATFVYLCVKKGISHWKKYASSKLLIPVYLFIAFLIYLLFSCLLAQDTHLAFYGSEYRNEGYYLYLAYAGVCFLSMLIEHDKKKIIYNTLICVAMFLAVIGFIDFQGKERVFTYWNSMSAIFTNPNHYGYFLVIPIICSVMLLESEKWYLKIAYLVSYVVLLLTLINTTTSGSYMAIFITIVAILIYQIIAKKKWSFDTDLTNGTVTALAAAPVSVSATWFSTWMWVMTRERGRPVVGATVFCGTPSLVIPNWLFMTSSFNCWRVSVFSSNPSAKEMSLTFTPSIIISPEVTS